jgi:type II secretory pathway pseudopilin PulG
MRRRKRQDDSGETLVELLLTITILSITVVSVLGAVLIAVDSSSLDRRAVQGQSLLESWGESVVERTTDATYATCATTASYPSQWAYYPQSAGGPLQNLPSGFTASVSNVEYWSGTAFVTSGCTAANDTGVQRVTLRMVVGATVYPGLTSEYSVVVRKPCLAC